MGPAGLLRPMRILWVKLGALWPLNTGGRIRSFNILKELSRHHRMVLVTTHGPEDDPEALARQLPSCENVISLRHAAPKYGTLPFIGQLLASWLSPL